MDALFLNANLATMSPIGPYGAIKDGALIVTGDRISWVGKRSDLPAGAEDAAVEIHDLGGCWVTPGLVDCHTHLVYGGSRAGEFELRLKGATYEEIARLGGGIRSTVAATRQADERSLYNQSLPRLQSLMAEGVTTLEIKSGYGLDLEGEGRLLYENWWLDGRYSYNRIPFRPRGMSPETLQHNCLSARREFYSWRSIAQRGFAPVNRSDWFMWRNFYLINALHRNDVSLRDHYPLGDESWQGQFLTAN